MKLRFRERIALYNLVAAAVITSLVFLVVYEVVFRTAFSHLDQDLRTEHDEVIQSLAFEGDSIVIAKMSEWEEQEHQQEEVNPTFLQLVDNQGRLLFRSSNLLADRFSFDPNIVAPHFFNTILKDQLVRLGQFPVKDKKGKILGQLSIGISRAESTVILKNLRTTLYVAFPLTLLVLYLAVSFAAAKSIAPVQELIQGTAAVSEMNTSVRLPLPPHEDEVQQLAKAINDLLQRIENGFKREKQFTSDASHELRTPLAAIRGTLEILIRKPRESTHYEEKIIQVIQEVDKMHLLLDRLLQLARLESGAVSLEKEPVELAGVFQILKTKNQPGLAARKMDLHLEIPPAAVVMADRTFLEILLNNLLGNALKYGSEGGNIRCTWDETSRSLTIADDGPGIPAEHLPHLFNRLYRADASRSSQVPGSGLGLSIVQKIAHLEQIEISVESEEGKGTSFTLRFPKV
ncbi:MAG: HAMP domain-containing protein [Lewinellaceae bacterium]|nr:HAMP domain-containing protein [Saprospiraceae bacterium]MCB9338486.1 HAMP domain-containing protein [Lewinellaceae bacterium]